MRRALLALAVVTSLFVAGCTTGQPGSTATDAPTPASSPTLTGSTASQTATATQTPGTVPSTATPTAEPTPTAQPTTVEYRVRPGELPDEFASFEVTLRAVFVDDTRDLGPCYPGVFSGPFQPTLTPLPTPTGTCHESDSVTVDLTEVSGERSLGNFTAPGSTSGHALIATEVDAAYANGTAVTTIYGMGGAELIRSDEPPSGPYGVQIGSRPVEDDRAYDYWFLNDPYDVTE